MSSGGKYSGGGGSFGGLSPISGGGLDPFQSSLVADIFQQNQAATGSRFAQLGLGDSTMATDAANANRLGAAAESAKIEQGNVGNYLKQEELTQAAQSGLGNALGTAAGIGLGAIGL